MIVIVASATIVSAGARESDPGTESESVRGDVEAQIARTDLGGAVKAALGDAFAGVWFDPATAQVHVGVTSPSSRQIVEAVSARAGMSDAVTETTVASRWTELEAAQKELNLSLEDLFARGEVATGIDPVRNSVEVEFGSDVPASRRGALHLEAVTLGVDASISVASHPRLVLQARARCKEFEKGEKNANCDKPIVAGVTLESEKGAICTAGPAVILQDLSTAEKATETYLLTAGHCIKEKGGALGNEFFAFTKEKGKKGEKKLIGLSWEYLRGTKGVAGDRVDVGIIRINHSPGNWANEGATPVIPGIAPWDKEKEVEPFAVTAQGPAEPMQGTEVCVSGQRTGTTCKGLIKAVGKTRTVEKNGEEWMVDKVVEVEKAETEEGDSGAPWVLKGEPGAVLGTEIGGLGAIAVYQSLGVTFANLETKLQLLTTKNEKRVHPGPITSGETGYTLPVGTKITAKSTNAKIVTSLGTLTCAQVSVNGELTENKGSTFRGVGKGEGSASTCFIGGSKAITITDITLNEVHSGASGSGTVNVTFKADLPAGITCHFQSPNMPFTYTSGTDGIKFTKGDMAATPPACEPGLLDGEFILEQTGGGSIKID